MLRERQERTGSIIRGVDRALMALEEEKPMDATEMFEGLEEFDHAQYEDEVKERLAELLAEGAHAAGRAAMDLAEEHRCHIDRWFYPCSHKMHRGLAEMYTADPRFMEYFEKRAEGLAVFVQDAILANAARSRSRQ